MPAFSFCFFFFCFYFVAKKAWLLVGIALSEAPCNEPTLIFTDFPSLLLALLAWILLLLPNKDVSRPVSIPKPCSLTAWQSSPATSADWERVLWLSLCPAAPSLLAIRQEQVRLTVCWDPALSPGGGNQKKRLCWEPWHEVLFAVQSVSMISPSPEKLAVLHPSRGSQEHLSGSTPGCCHPFGPWCGADVLSLPS